MSINPFTPMNIVFIIKSKIDETADREFIICLNKLRERLIYAAPEMQDAVFWGDTNTMGLPELFNMFVSEDHKKFKELNKIYKEVILRWSNNKGFGLVSCGTEST